jgi:hypothetical protein
MSDAQMPLPPSPLEIEALVSLRRKIAACVRGDVGRSQATAAGPTDARESGRIALASIMALADELLIAADAHKRTGCDDDGELLASFSIVEALFDSYKILIEFQKDPRLNDGDMAAKYAAAMQRAGIPPEISLAHIAAHPRRGSCGLN